MSSTYPVHHVSRGSVLHVNENARYYAERVLKAAWEAHSAASKVLVYVSDRWDRPEWETSAAASARAARAKLADALAELDKAIATYDALPVSSEYLEAAE